ncbi:MAG TPA: AzlD domain-containing protein [Treponemataceae bacterium]|nr:AzlD domain-containing protein [Treponemataceae bacterium]
MTSLSQALIATVLMALVTLATRAFPFLLFSRRDPPAVLKFVEKFIPPMVMAVLVIYSLKDISWTVLPSGLREIGALILVTILHMWKKNAMLSIFGGTAFYMILLRVIS